MSDDLGLPPPNVDIEEPVEVSAASSASPAPNTLQPLGSASPTISSSSSSFVPIDQHHVQDAIQVINEHKQFNQQIMEYIHGATLPGQIVGNDYHIISVFGSQSTGKSTLLNRLFNTNFDVMEESRRQQTTKGIWMAVSPEVSTTSSKKSTENVFVMDVEGTDGRERGEDQDFERKAALFALATSEILIINIWETQVGLYQGANMGLLKTVFEVNLSLFGQSKLENNTHKVLLLIVIRDHIGVTPLQALAETLITDLNKMWLDLSKPAELSHLKFSDFFDVDFHALHHKVLQPDEFSKDVKLLGDRLVVKKELFKPNYHHQIPVDGWTMYAENCWDQIDNNKDLDLPTQQILVAKFKCDEISNGVYDEFVAKHHGLFDDKVPGENVDYEQMGLAMVDLREDTLDDYDTSASRYNQTIYEQKRQALKEKIHAKFREVFDVHAKWVVETGVGQFATDIKKLKTRKDKSFFQGAQELEHKYVSLINTSLQLISLGEFHDSEVILDVKARFDAVVAKQQVVEMKAIIGRALAKIDAGVSKALQQELASPDDQTWERVMARFHELLAEVKARYAGTGTVPDFGLGTSDSDNVAGVERLQVQAWVALHSVVHRVITRDSVLQLMKDKFEDVFRYDENGMPRLYQKVEELETSFGAARKQTQQMVPVLEEMRTSEGAVVPRYSARAMRAAGFGARARASDAASEGSDDDSNSDSDDSDNETTPTPFSQVLSPADRDHVASRFKRETDAQFVETKRLVIQHATHIPYYVWLVMLVLGWGKLVAILRNPFLFALLLMAAAGVYVLHSMLMLRPAMVVVSRMGDEAVVQIKAKLRQVLLDTEDDPAQVHGARMAKMGGHQR
ncbi:putative stress-related vesicular transport protein [Suhomyces tanzawaensis NRRL Y-17324]|uniref:Putative stress-related vesicular transport protein n=1 Tax=Suhomyces tanzawaensis NRRL Y-17324 TaxID=984487 RepID=A0A1E4SCC9_9ASCO|nr:putative stress-related vesicular transport protein [Suhomyces tanzawaensis NRRL Y-17324]ODV77171.1 putative stress-related vesicular transport protein [Suhomyces tanzawaensis NRRL Y-17324]